MEPKTEAPKEERRKEPDKADAEHPPERELPNPDHIVVEPVEGAAQAFGAAVAGGVSAILPVLGNLFKEDGSLSLPALFGLTIFVLLLGWGLLQALGRARQREVFWEATKDGLTVHMDNIGPLSWDQVRAVEPVTAGPGWLTGEPVISLKIHLWMPMDVRRRMKSDPDVKFLVRAPVMGKNDRFLRLPLWQTKMREHAEEIAMRLQEWHAGPRRR